MLIKRPLHQAASTSLRTLCFASRWARKWKARQGMKSFVDYIEKQYGGGPETLEKWCIALKPGTGGHTTNNTVEGWWTGLEGNINRDISTHLAGRRVDDVIQKIMEMDLKQELEDDAWAAGVGVDSRMDKRLREKRDMLERQAGKYAVCGAGPVYQVASSRGDALYTVTVTDGRAECSCPANAQDGPCNHIYSVAIRCLGPLERDRVTGVRCRPHVGHCVDVEDTDETVTGEPSDPVRLQSAPVTRSRSAKDREEAKGKCKT